MEQQLSNPPEATKLLFCPSMAQVMTQEFRKGMEASLFVVYAFQRIKRPSWEAETKGGRSVFGLNTVQVEPDSDPDLDPCC